MAKEATPKEIEEQRAKYTKKTLDWNLMRESVGSNLVRTNPYFYAGQLGLQSAESVYDKSMSGDDAKKEKDNLYKARKQEGEQLGVFGEPAYPSNYDLSVKLMRQLEEAMAGAKLSELEKAAKSVGAKLSFEVPEELKNYSYADLQPELAKHADEEGKVNIESLPRKEQHAIGLYNVLRESYKRACALKATQANYFTDLDEQGKKIADSYKPKENKK